jgi:hypothetical protein
MIKKERIIAEIRTIILTTLYFFCWFGGLMVIKVLLLKEYNIEFSGFTIVVVSALVIAKVVLLLEYVPIPYTKDKPAWVAVLIRTFFYLAGVFAIIVLEKSFEARHEYGGVLEAAKNLEDHTNSYHVWANTICVFGALLMFNIWSIVKLKFGKGIFRKLMMSKIQEFNN